MVSEWEKEELGRLTHQKIEAFSKQKQQRDAEVGIQPGRMTLQNLQCMKSVQKQTDTKEAKAKLLLERLKMAVSTSLTGLFSLSALRSKDDKCKTYGHNLPWGTAWKGEFPRCLDCNVVITEASQLRGSLPMDERSKFKSYGEK